MKRPVLNSIFTGLFFLFFLASCQEKEEPPTLPSIRLVAQDNCISGDTVMPAGATLNFGISAQKGSFNLTNLLINVEGSELLTYFDTGMNTSSIELQKTFIKTTEAVETWHFIIRDRESYSSLYQIVIRLDSNAQYQPLISYPAQIFDAQESDPALRQCFGLDGGTVFSYKEAVADVELQQKTDMIYFYGPDLATMGSAGANVEDGIFDPPVQEWEIRNTSRYHPADISTEEFNSAQNDSILIVYFNESEAKRKAKDLDAGKVFVFITEDSRLGMFHVDAMEPGPTGQVTVRIKYQSTSEK